MGRVGFDPATADHDVARFTLGARYSNHSGTNKGTFRYVKNVDDNDLAAGDVALVASASDFDVCRGTGTGTVAIGTAGVGVAVGAITSGNYGFVLTNGIGSVKVPAATAAGTPLGVPGAADGISESTFTGKQVGETIAVEAGGLAVTVVAF